MDLSIVQWETDAVRSALVATAVVGTLWYLLRVLAALVLVVASRWRPGAGGAALRWAPAPLRPLIGRAVLGGLLVAGLAGPAAAADDGCSEASPMPILDRGDRCAAAAEAGAADRPSRQAPTALPVGEQSNPGSGTTITVSAGDSLWSITTALLGTEATTASIAAAWPALWQANAALIGPDPGLIHPGQTLTVPAVLTTAVAP
jgi:hypothetical protein